MIKAFPRVPTACTKQPPMQSSPARCTTEKSLPVLWRHLNLNVFLGCKIYDSEQYLVGLCPQPRLANIALPWCCELGYGNILSSTKSSKAEKQSLMAVCYKRLMWHLASRAV